MLSRVGSKALRVLDRPGRRGLLTLPGSIWVSVKYRAPCLVRWRDGRWVHHYRGAKIPHAGFRRAAPPHVLTAEARDIFLYAYTPEPGDVVFDVGAGIGAETLLFSRLVAVISDSSEHLRNMVGEGDDGIRVESRRLDTLGSELGIAHIDFLKMNIEGAERAALVGAGTLLDHTLHVCISCHDFLADEGGPDALRTKAFVREFLRARNFEITTRDDAEEPWTRDYVYGART